MLSDRIVILVIPWYNLIWLKFR